MRTDEAGLVVEHRDVLVGLPPQPTALRHAIDPTEDPVADCSPIGLCSRHLDADLRGIPQRRQQVRWMNEHLGRDASGVQTQAAEPRRPFDERDLHVGESFVDDRVPRP